MALRMIRHLIAHNPLLLLELYIDRSEFTKDLGRPVDSFVPKSVFIRPVGMTAEEISQLEPAEMSSQTTSPAQSTAFPTEETPQPGETSTPITSPTQSRFKKWLKRR